MTQSPETGGDTRADEMEQQEDDGMYESGDLDMHPLGHVEDSDSEEEGTSSKELPETIGAVILSFQSNRLWTALRKAKMLEGLVWNLPSGAMWIGPKELLEIVKEYLETSKKISASWTWWLQPAWKSQCATSSR